MKNNKKIEKLNILNLDDKKNIFDTDIRYQIPLYQRDFEWKDKEISQLIEDINDIDLKGNKNYYLGSLIVSTKNSNIYEIIDGQQRLTTLYVLFNCINEKTKNTLRFECRDKSNTIITDIRKIIDKNNNEIKENEIDDNEKNIINAIRIVKRELKNINLEDFRKKLSRVVIFKIEVPKNTDLNKYFEIMNTRGKQLAQQDILKSNLMSNLSNDKDRNIFTNIWDACSNMDNYVEMSFSESIRKKLFKTDCNIPSNSWKDYQNINFENIKSNESYKIDEIINSKFNLKNLEAYYNDKTSYTAILDFPTFLLHILAVYVRLNKKNDNSKDKKSKNLDNLKLISVFEKCIKQENNKEKFTKEFLILLFRCRVIFDRYFIKRDKNEKWSLKYKNTNVLMLESLLRVTYTSQKSAHWITELLYWLTKDNFKNIKGENINKFEGETEDFIKEEVRKNFFKITNKKTDSKGISNRFSEGTNTHHIAFNYLDYLLWKENKEKYKDFTFEFRNSVEHWYPQNPSEGTFDKWENEEKLNYFGNLCLVTTEVNSKLSNLIPSSKKQSVENYKNKGSIKLRIMAEQTVEIDGKNANYYWKEKGFLSHGKEMITILEKACNIKI